MGRARPRSESPPVSWGIVTLHVFAACLRLRLGRGFEIDDNAAARVPLRNGLLEHDLGIAEVAGRNAAKDVRGHHTHRRPPQDFLGEGADPVPQHDLLVILRDDSKAYLLPHDFSTLSGTSFSMLS